MLILSRKKDESIIIDKKIEIKIIAIEEGKVRLGISAPKDIEIHRKEVYLEVQRENKEAAGGSLNLEALGDLLKK
ncbi:carbon storage regulator CsrA [Crassaminicella thermophila]|uniref:Translational regulator CsrA n=1 Tax=Crassaminicella thermophila TaxID=2599308 RepID=A0A5C0SB54_CRATE|nr:carbon storage regulator CsrA [Crassaminicella thermophila]QEK11310.1 carbon storage regulator CsrA [Crassaminicella thermophila]